MAARFGIYRNRHHDIEFTYKLDGVAQDISSAELIFRCLERKGIGTRFDKKNTAAGGGDAQISWVSDGTDGKFYIHFLPADTAEFTQKKYFFEIRMKLSGKITTIGQDEFVLKGVYI